MQPEDFNGPAVAQIVLPIEQFCASCAVSDALLVAPENLKQYWRYMLREMARQFTIMLSAPTAPIQDRVVCEYPTSLWQHVKKTVGLKHHKTVVRFKELCVYPGIAIPPHTTTCMRIYRHADLIPSYAKENVV